MDPTVGEKLYTVQERGYSNTKDQYAVAVMRGGTVHVRARTCSARTCSPRTYVDTYTDTACADYYLEVLRSIAKWPNRHIKALTKISRYTVPEVGGCPRQYIPHSGKFSHGAKFLIFSQATSICENKIVFHPFVPRLL